MDSLQYIDCDNLVSLIRQRPILYDENHKNRFDRRLRAKAWTEIAKEMSFSGTFSFFFFFFCHHLFFFLIFTMDFKIRMAQIVKVSLIVYLRIRTFKKKVLRYEN